MMKIGSASDDDVSVIRNEIEGLPSRDDWCLADEQIMSLIARIDELNETVDALRKRNDEQIEDLVSMAHNSMCQDGHRRIVYMSETEECPMCAEIKQKAELIKALGPDLAGRTLPELLRVSAAILFNGGGGPIEDCLNAAADRIEAVLAEVAG